MLGENWRDVLGRGYHLKISPSGQAKNIVV